MRHGKCGYYLNLHPEPKFSSPPLCGCLFSFSSMSYMYKCILVHILNFIYMIFLTKLQQNMSNDMPLYNHHIFNKFQFENFEFNWDQKWSLTF